MSNDIEIQAPAAILMYKRRWRIEVWFKAVKQEINLAMFQLQQLELIGSHFQLRGICYTQRQLKLRFFLRWSPGMPYPNTWLKAQFLAMRSISGVECGKMPRICAPKSMDVEKNKTVIERCAYRRAVARSRMNRTSPRCLP